MDYQFYSIIIAAFAAIVATAGVIVATFSAIWHGRQTQKHNRLSVKPILTFSQIFAFTGSEGYAGISIKNDGLGPAIVKKYTVFVKGESFPLATEDNARAILNEIDLDEPWVSYGTVTDSGAAISPGQEIWIFYLERDRQHEDRIVRANRIVRAKKALVSVKIVAEFESIYGEEDSVDTD